MVENAKQEIEAMEVLSPGEAALALEFIGDMKSLTPEQRRSFLNQANAALGNADQLPGLQGLIGVARDSLNATGVDSEITTVDIDSLKQRIVEHREIIAEIAPEAAISDSLKGAALRSVPISGVGVLPPSELTATNTEPNLEGQVR